MYIKKEKITEYDEKVINACRNIYKTLDLIKETVKEIEKSARLIEILTPGKLRNDQIIYHNMVNLNLADYANIYEGQVKALTDLRRSYGKEVDDWDDNGFPATEEILRKLMKQLSGGYHNRLLYYKHYILSSLHENILYITK